MSILKLVLPDASWHDAVEEYKQEFLENHSSLDGTGGLVDREFEPWLENLIKNRSEETVAPGLVPATTFLIIREADNRLVGMIDIRHRLNDYLLKFGGHIGYSVRPTERRKGYAKEGLRLALEICKDLGIEKALVTCNKTNIGSAKTIQSNGGVLENEIDTGERITQRYWINMR